MNAFILKIAEIGFRFTSDENLILECDANHQPFRMDETGENYVNIHVSISKPANFENFIQIFTAPGYIEETKQFTDDKLWSVATNKDQTWIITWNTDNNSQFEFAATFDKHYKNWHLLANPNFFTSNSIVPTKYPIFLLMLFYVLTENQGIMVHASGVWNYEKGRLFSGFSGVGKSTMSKIWYDSGALIINDDRLIIRKIGDEIIIFNSPMFYPTPPRNCVLNEIFLIRHASQNESKKLGKLASITRFLAFCIQQDYKKELVDHVLNMMQIITNQVAVYELGFVPNSDVISYINTDEHLK